MGDDITFGEWVGILPWDMPAECAGSMREMT